MSANVIGTFRPARKSAKVKFRMLQRSPYMRASRGCTSWKLQIGCPNCSRSLRVLERQLEGAVREAEGEGRHAGALVGEPALHVVALLDPTAEQVRARNADLVQVDGARRRGVRAHLAEGLRDLEPRGAALDEEGLDVLGAV